MRNKTKTEGLTGPRGGLKPTQGLTGPKNGLKPSCGDKGGGLKPTQGNGDEWI
jgi:hypothetical protein